VTVGGLALYLNSLSDDAARAALDRCCGAARWVEGMLAARPYASDVAVFDAAERVWWGRTQTDWLEAFRRHPRIGEREHAEAWARQEQAGMDGAPAATRAALANGNRVYETRFGHVFLICATGRTPEDMRRELERRLRNDPAAELRIAASEQAKITRLRLEKLGPR